MLVTTTPRQDSKGGLSPRFRLLRPVLSYLAVLSLLLQALLPLGQSWALSIQEFETDFKDRYVICTASGLKIISLVTGDDGQPYENITDLSCPACSLTSVTQAPQPVSDPLPCRQIIVRCISAPDHSTPAFTVLAPLPPVRGPPNFPSPVHIS
ncbi:hypothetical protein O4H49_11930 [Kiloniella laminariae]|uniref:DUF2946 domain-containing protein n=1 Tax=Kiloniella laminariae TaxID=454162 RepID=A0ABT4LM88_9PROT|nr:hypothetical protein [Kiloniella laminariae]MCZ4281491.1 hypothetical protein [Kiloniella laminariae]